MSISLRAMTPSMQKFPSETHSGKAGGYNHPKLFVSSNCCDYYNLALWAVHVKDHVSDLVSLSLAMFLMSQDRGAVGMWACHRCHTPILENHQADKVPRPDSITNAMLRHLEPKTREELLWVINFSWKTGDVPREWCTASVVPILMPGKKRNFWAATGRSRSPVPQAG